MSATLTQHNAAAAALVAQLPSTAPLVAIPAPPDLAAEHAGTAILAAHIGARSADLALVIAPDSDLAGLVGAAQTVVSEADVVRPALEAAAATLGEGLLGELELGDAAAILADPTTAVFELAGDGRTAGWFAVRLRPERVAASAPIDGRINRISSVEMTLTVEIGRTRMPVRDVLALEPGAVIELDRSAGAPADVLLNGRLIARGEIVVVDQDYAVRITEILDTAEQPS